MKKNTIYSLIFFFLFFPISIYSINFKHIGIAEGLSQLSVMSIHQDKLGRMWFGTEEGLNMYDGQRIKVFKPRYKIDAFSTEGNDGLLGNNNYPITEDKNGNLYFCSDAALIQFNLLSQEFRRLRKTDVATVTSHQGDVWFAARDSIFKISNDTILFVSQVPRGTQINALHIHQGEIWIGSSFGLHMIGNNKEYKTIIPTTNILSIFEDSRQHLWVASLGEGAFEIDKSLTIRNYIHERDNQNSISSNLVRCFAEDSTGKLWIGTFKGLDCLDPTTGKFTFYTSGQKHELSHSSVFSLCKDHQGNMWVGTYYGGVNYFSPETNIFSYYSEADLHFPFIGSMVEDSQRNLWICTEGGGLTCLNRNNQTLQHFEISWQNNGNRVRHNNLKAICYEPISQRLFIGTHTGGLSCYNLKTRTFKHYYPESPGYASMLGSVVDNLAIYKNQLFIQVRGGLFTMDLQTEKFAPLLNDSRYDHYWVRTFTVDSKGYIWIAGQSGLVYINLNQPSDTKLFSSGKNGLGKFYVTKIIEASNHQIYVGTRGSGLCKYIPTTQSFQTYTQASNRLLSDYCYDIAISQRGVLIITGNRGITLFDPKENSSKFIGLENSVPISAINIGCKVYVCKDGEIFVGGVDGLMAFKEKSFDITQPKSQLYFSTLWVNNQEVYPGDRSQALTQTLPVTKSIILNHNQNNITLNFASTNYVSITHGGIYEYKLAGLDDHWNTTNHTSISYTNLPIGTYELIVREKNVRSSSHIPQEATLLIEIFPPFYRTIWAYLFYSLAALCILSSFIRFYYSRMKLKATIEFERAGKERIQELNQAKINFFTTVSHEFRTPLTLIISQMELLMQSNTLNPNTYNKMSKIYKNAQSMKELISELLTFQKLNQEAVLLKAKEFNLHTFLNEIYLSFTDYANAKHIIYEFSSPNSNITCWADATQLKKVFNNLLSNAFKYTEEFGKIELVIKELEDTVDIQIIDNGCGISPDEQKKIFDTFYQAKDNTKNNNTQTGTGIGLSLVKKIVEAHHGEIRVSSQINYGSIFTVTIKKGKAHLLDDASVLFQENVDKDKETCLKLKEEIAVVNPETTPIAQHSHTILIIEDNPEMLQLLQTLFTPIYDVLIARDGKEGLEMAIETLPDIIISDIMMPKMSGKELCAHIKNNFDLCHIPIVLLTALDSDKDKLEGLAQRADDYISKPFDSKQLIVRCNNLVHNKELLQKKFSKQEDSSTSYILATNPLDKKFLQQVDDIIVKNLDKEEFDMNQLTQEMNISRSSLYAKFKALSGVSPNEYLINCRLKHAATLLKKHPELQITEISYQVGFSSPRYFSKSFKNIFGMSPVDFRKGTKDISQQQ